MTFLIMIAAFVVAFICGFVKEFKAGTKIRLEDLPIEIMGAIDEDDD